MHKAKILFKDGTIIEACANIEKTVFGELVFNTSMTGYQEILTDPSYFGQIVIMTYPLIGNYGVDDKFKESENVQVAGFVIKENSNSDGSFSKYLKDNNVLCVSNVDTRKLTKIVRTHGAINCLITTDILTDDTKKEYLTQLKNYVFPKNVVEIVSRQETTTINAIGDTGQKIAVIDLGIKNSIIKQLIALDLDITIFPHNAKACELENFDAVLFSNGPGDPIEALDAINTAKALLGKIPMFGICLGHQILALAANAKTYKLKFGHRGGNHPVINTITNKVIMTSQNHGYAVDPDTFTEDSRVSHINLNDNTVEGFINENLRIKTAQFHPEAGPGPNDANTIFKEWFIEPLQ